MPKEKSDTSISPLEKPLEKSFSPSQIRPKISTSPIEETRIYTTNQPQAEPKPEVLILLVEDEKMNQLIVKRQLQQLGYKLDIAENGLDALKMLSKKAYQVIFMDCNMPIMDGYKATVEIRRLESEHNKSNSTKKHIPIIALTASDAQYPEKFFQAGMDDFLEKPFQINQFIAILEKWLFQKYLHRNIDTPKPKGIGFFWSLRK
ncbi:MAG: response regulator [Blastocatellia bacterium]|nr:response regulator [Blastocatellia bacterium]